MRQAKVRLKQRCVRNICHDVDSIYQYAAAIFRWSDVQRCDVICRANSLKGGETWCLSSSEEVVGFLERQIAGKRESFTTQPPHESRDKIEPSDDLDPVLLVLQ